MKSGAERINVLFLCTANSARSIIAECVMNRLGKDRFKAFSAGSDPSGSVHPGALALLQRQGYVTETLRSKGWQEFRKSDAAQMDFVFTVCDRAAAERCPIWPGQPVSAHWGIADPAAVEGSAVDSDRAFATAYEVLTHRVEALVDLPLDSMDEQELRSRLGEIGRSDE